MGPIRPTTTELAAQVSVTCAMELAAHHRSDRREYDTWIAAAVSANERTRRSMIERGVAMFTRTRSVNQ